MQSVQNLNNNLW